MKDPFVTESFIDSPSRESKHVDGCYSKNVLKNKSFLNSRRALQSGADKISRTFKNMRSTFCDLSQHFRLRSKRRHRLAETGSPCRTPCTPVTKKKQLLGRSPTKLYSPFGIETPRNKDFRISPYMPNTPEHDMSPKQRKGLIHWHLLGKKRPRALFQ
ncbi:unnamed protein product [Leptosia nina]|uniref:Uncharacterized protein n=1 Tax=Leptosia nina TaxID=320188 RepID=A0AAV1IWF8_9NEOP